VFFLQLAELELLDLMVPLLHFLPELFFLSFEPFHGHCEVGFPFFDLLTMPSLQLGELVLHLPERLFVLEPRQKLELCEVLLKSSHFEFLVSQFGLGLR
jgi:hypothetical protein